jgi:hypothetical protein
MPCLSPPNIKLPGPTRPNRATKRRAMPEPPMKAAGKAEALRAAVCSPYLMHQTKARRSLDDRTAH